MAKSIDTSRKSEPVDLQDFVFALSTALHGAAARFPKDDRPPIVVGAWTGPILTNPTMPGFPGGGGGGGHGHGVSAPQIPSDLRGAGRELSEEGVARLNKHLIERRDGAEVAIALFAEPVRAMRDLFELDEDQVAEMQEDSCNRASLPFMHVAAQAIKASAMPMALDFKISDDARAQKGKKKWCVQSFSVGGGGTVSGGPSGTSGGGTVSGSVTFGRCKK